MPNYEVKDLVKRLKWLLAGEGKEPVIKPMTDCVFLSGEKEFKELLTTGKVKIDYRGISEIDYTNKSVIVKSVPPGKTFIGLLKKLQKEIEINKTISWIDESTKSSKVRFSSAKRTFTLDNLSKKINNNLIGSMTYECNMCDDSGNVVLVSIDQMLLNVYRRYKTMLEKFLKDNITKLQTAIYELNLIAKIKVVLPKWLKNHPDEIGVVVEGISAETSIPDGVVKEIFNKYTLSRILKIKIDIVNLENQKNELIANLNNIDIYLWDSRYNTLLS